MNGTIIRIIKGDITKIKTDAIVNAANSSLLGGDGVDGAIHRTGGPQILEECKKIVARQGSCKTGEAVITTAGKLDAKFVIHTVGPVWNGGNKNEAEKLTACYRNSLELAIEHNCETIAFPCISTGVYGYPINDAAEVAIETVKSFIKDQTVIKKVIFVCFGEDNYNALKQAYK
jgi:O-acetyl-ADP-ribose deacetylase